MIYIIGQGFGLLATICCFIGPFFKKKWQMLVNSIAANLFVIINLVMLDQIGSGVVINSVAITQLLLSLWHVNKNKPVTTIENIVYLIAYVGLGFIGFKGVLDILPIIGAIFFMIGAFQRDEQKSRKIGLANAITYLIYYVIISSTSALAQVASIIMTSLALYKYRKKTTERMEVCEDKNFS